MTNLPPLPPTLDALEGLGFDPEAILVQEPRVVLDRRFLAALHRELAGQLRWQEGAAILLQLGFLRGLRDAHQVLRRGFADGLALAANAEAAPVPLAIRLEPPPVAGGACGIEFCGSWPEQLEAEARLSAVGVPSEPGCFLSAGYSSGWLSGVMEARLVVIETECAALGAAHCRFSVREAEAWSRDTNPVVDLHLRALPFDAAREWVARCAAADPDPPESSFEVGTPVVHVWGPVMVIPFSGADETLTAVELIGRDPGARGVSVVVVDLAGTLIDEGFGAAALERVVERVYAWGAEPILTGVSPLCESVIADFAERVQVIRKGLPEAIAAAFQIAGAQRRPN